MSVVSKIFIKSSTAPSKVQSHFQNSLCYTQIVVKLNSLLCRVIDRETFQIT